MLVYLLSCLLTSPTWAADGDSLWPRLEGLDQASGAFEQELISTNGELLERSSGRYAVLKPGFFRWEIEQPDRQQIIVADGMLWHYDIDLATATQRPTAELDDFTAMDLLTSDGSSLRQRFDVERLEDDRYRLRPTFPRAGFNSVDLTWDGDELVAMAIRDRSGQLLRLALKPRVDAPTLSAADFAFALPEGVEVFSAEGF